MSLYEKHKKLSAAVSARPGWQHPFNVVQKRRLALVAAQKKANKKWEKKAQNRGGRRRSRRKRSRRRRSRRRSRRRRRRTRRGGRQRYATNDKYWVVDLQTAADGAKKIAKRHKNPVRKLGHHSKLLLHDVMYGTNHLDRALGKRHSSSHHKTHHKKSRRKRRHHHRKTRYGLITGLRNSP